MAVTTVVLPETNEEKVCLGFTVKFDSDADQIDAIYRALKGIPGSRVEYLDSKKVRADIPVQSGQGKPESLV